MANKITSATDGAKTVYAKGTADYPTVDVILTYDDGTTSPISQPGLVVGEDNTWNCSFPGVEMGNAKVNMQQGGTYPPLNPDDSKPVKITNGKEAEEKRNRRGREAEEKGKLWGGGWGGGTLTISSPSPGASVSGPFYSMGTINNAVSYNVSGTITTFDGTVYTGSMTACGPNWTIYFPQPTGSLAAAVLKVWCSQDSTLFAQESFGGIPPLGN